MIEKLKITENPTMESLTDDNATNRAKINEIIDFLKALMGLPEVVEDKPCLGVESQRHGTCKVIEEHVKEYHRKDYTTTNDVNAMIGDYIRKYHGGDSDPREEIPEVVWPDAESRELFESMKITHTDMARLLVDMGSHFKEKL